MVLRIALTLGEPAGIGPDLCALIAAYPHPFEVVVIGSAALLQARAERLGCALQLNTFDPTQSAQPNGQGQLSIVDVPLRADVIPGVLNPANSPYVIEVLNTGAQLCQQQQCDALLTLPVHKAVIAQAGIPFKGHTEYFAQLAKVDEVLMTFYTPRLILALLTTHMPLQDVPKHVTPARLESAIRLLSNGLSTVLKRPQAKIGVLGLNPHAGENGLLGTEEQTCITPVIQRLQQEGLALEGPISADTAFTPAALAHRDALLAMYHDQGLSPIKALYFGHIVNVTLGLPYLRISVDHGTALDKAGTADISTQSLEACLSFLAQWGNAA